MSVHANLVAETLEILYDHLVSPGTIDAAQDCGKIGLTDVVLTSFGNAEKATITPFYPGFQLGCNLQQRIERAQLQQRSFVEASVKVKKDSLDQSRISTARVTLRLCLNPQLNTTSTVLETASLYDLDGSRPYGTMESVLDEVLRNYDTGVEVPSASGQIVVTREKLASRNGNWGVSVFEDPEVVALKIKIGTSEVPFKRNFLEV